MCLIFRRIKDAATELTDIFLDTGYDFDFLCEAVEELVDAGCTYEQALNQVRDISYEQDW
jgi:hypothetical protein